MEKQKNYRNYNIIASNGYVGILDIKYGIDDKVLTTLNNRYSKIKYDTEGQPYFIKYGVKYYLNEFFKTNYNTL